MGRPNSWASLSLNYTVGKMRLADGVTFALRYVVLSEFASGVTSGATVDIFQVMHPGESALLSITDGGAVTRYCFPASMAGAVYLSVPRPASLPGNNTYEPTSAVPASQLAGSQSCSNSSSAPPLSRCWGLVGRYVDYGAPAAQYDSMRQLIPNGYAMHLVNVFTLCQKVLSGDCIYKYGPLGCYVVTMQQDSAAAAALLPPPAPTHGSPPPPPSSPDGGAATIELSGGQGGVIAPADGAGAAVPPPAAVAIGGGSERSRVALGPIVGGVVGGVVGVLLVAGLVVASVRWHRSRQLFSNNAAVGFDTLGTIDAVGDVGQAGAGRAVLPPMNTNAVAGCAFTQEGAHSLSPEGVGNTAPIGGQDRALTAAELFDTASSEQTPLHTHPRCASPGPGLDSDRGRLQEDAALVTSWTPRRPDVALGPRQAEEVTLLPVVRGRGAYGKVYEGLYGGQRVAVKVLAGGFAEGDDCAARQMAEVRSLAQEVEVLGRCDHPHVVRLLAACLTPPRRCLVMELCEASLDRLVLAPGAAPLPLPVVLHIAMQVCRGLEYLHPTIMHRDLKPANVLLLQADSPRPIAKLSDFGLSRIRAATMPTLTPEAGTPAYMAPECFDPTNHIITHKVDIYSFGILVWVMLTGREPWEDLNLVQLAYRVTVQHQRPDLEHLGEERCPRKLRRLLEACWDADPLRRPAAAEVGKELLLLVQQVAVGSALEAPAGPDAV